MQFWLNLCSQIIIFAFYSELQKYSIIELHVHVLYNFFSIKIAICVFFDIECGAVSD